MLLLWLKRSHLFHFYIIVVAIIIVVLFFSVWEIQTQQEQNQLLHKRLSNGNIQHHRNLKKDIPFNTIDEPLYETKEIVSMKHVETNNNNKHEDDSSIDSNDDDNNNKYIQMQNYLNMITKEYAKQHQMGNTNNKNNLTAIIHVGPMKTGSSSIQKILHQNIDTLLKDNYVYGNMYSKPHPSGIFTCFDDVSLLTDPENECQISILQNIRQEVSVDQNHNVIISSEGFSSPNMNIKNIKQYLIASGFTNIIIVMYYRRLYEWLLSLHNQGNKIRDIPKRISIINYIIDIIKYYNDNDPRINKYTVASYQRYIQYFDNVQLYNMHTLPKHGDVREGLLCNAIKSIGMHSCALLHQVQNDEEKEEEVAQDHEGRTNTHQPLIYEELTYYAKEMNLWNNDLNNNKNNNKNNHTFQDVVELVKEYQENVLQLTEYDFDINNTNTITCPSEDTYEWLLNTTLQIEEQLFPAYYQQQGKNEIIEHFYLSKSKFCLIDAKSVLIYSEQWRQFFQSV